jgi:hypothetical protein
MEEAINHFIEYTELSESTLEGRNKRYQHLLRDIATGSWVFPKEFDAWRLKAQVNLKPDGPSDDERILCRDESGAQLVYLIHPFSE